jgi:sterol desaturase/sphingolipid hydroxylase (fatty acid hydroxylase superfamily)
MNPPAILRFGTYPVVVTSACVAFYVMAKRGVPELIAAYAPVLCALALIALYELRYPFRRSWRPDRRTFAIDATFTLLVQVALPSMLALGYALIASTLTSNWQLRDLWPHGLPATVQVVVMVVAAEALRYPLHRAMHTRPGLWRFHAVHHSPGRLYWLNVGRFHPVEKSIQGLFDVLPFVVVGVDHWVLSGYFVFYAVNGFFQHSNCHISLGPLNHLIAGPELHRWHHSAVVEEGGSNYGNNLIIFDALFGSRYLPDDREVATLGIGDPDYPDGFVASLRKPFE